MPALSAVELALAKQAAMDLLEQVGLEAYLFELRLQDPGPWELRVDCAVRDGWQSLSIPIQFERLLASRQDRGIRADLLRQIEERLTDCRKEGQ